jgi:radical SAM superfamily enzyme YgiQ (UPF0313 family)
MANRTAIGYVNINPPANQADWHDRKVFAGSIAESKTDKELQYYHVLPYQYGLFQAYLNQFHNDELSFQLPVFIAQSIEETAASLVGNDLVGYSCYPWNTNYNLALAKKVKQLSLSTINIFGGPKISTDAEDFLRENSSIDIVCFGEGEKSFSEIVKHYRTKVWDSVPGVGWISDHGEYCETEISLLSQAELESCISPYQMGVFDELIQQYPNINWQMPMETNRGCPFACKYCSWTGTEHKKIREFSRERAQADLQWAVDNNISNILVCDANFGLLERDDALVDLVIESSKPKKTITSFVVQTPCDPGKRGFGIHQKLINNHLSCPITVGIQSRSPEVLKISGRQYQDRDQLKKVFNNYKKINAQCYCDLILGLPGETYHSFSTGITETIECGQLDACYVYFFSPLVNTVMHSDQYRKQYELQTVSQKSIDSHAPLHRQSFADEFHEIVVFSLDMPKKDWQRAVVFKWLSQFLFFSRMVHIPLCLGLHLFDLDLHKTIESFIDPDPELYPLLASISQQLFDQAGKIQSQGEPELVLCKYTKPIYWPMEQALILNLTHGEQLGTFYREAEELLVNQVNNSMHKDIIRQSCQLNQVLLRMPFLEGDTTWKGNYNIKEMYRSILANTIIFPEQGEYCYQIIRTRPQWKTWQGWHDHLQFCHLQKKYYLYGLKRI